jgi:hypothetical protein
MKLRSQFGEWFSGRGWALVLSAALAVLLPLSSAAGQRVPAKDRARVTGRQNDRPPNAGSGVGNNGHPNVTEGRPKVTTPPPNVQERFRNMTPQEKQRLLQNEERLRHLPPAQQQVLRDRAQVWRRMTPEQRDHIRNDVLPKWKQMPPDRRQAIQQRLRVLQNMPEYARNQRLNDPNFTHGMSEDDRATLRDLSHLHVGGAPEPPGE